VREKRNGGSERRKERAEKDGDVKREKDIFF